MLKRRLEGVLRQYGPVVAFLVTDVVLKNTSFTKYAKERKNVEDEADDPESIKSTAAAGPIYVLLRSLVGATEADHLLDYPTRTPAAVVVEEVARMRDRLSQVFLEMLDRRVWYAWHDHGLMGPHHVGARDPGSFPRSVPTGKHVGPHRPRALARASENPGSRVERGHLLDQPLRRAHPVDCVDGEQDGEGGSGRRAHAESQLSAWHRRPRVHRGLGARDAPRPHERTCRWARRTTTPSTGTRR